MDNVTGSLGMNVVYKPAGHLFEDVAGEEGTSRASHYLLVLIVSDGLFTTGLCTMRCQ